MINPCGFTQNPSTIIFSRVTKKDGLASNTIFQVLQDKQGFLWIATQNGLQRYDGNRCMSFRHIPGDSSSISSNSISHLYLDKKDRLWLLSDKKIGIFNTTTFKFTETKINTPFNIIKKVMEDEQGRIILFVDYNKLFIYDEAKHLFASAYPLPALPANYTIGDMAIDHSSGSYWFTGKQGCFTYNPVIKQFNYKENNSVNKDPMLESFDSIKNTRYPFISKNDTYWMVSWAPFTGIAPVLYSYDKKKKLFHSFEKIREYKSNSYYEIWSLFEQSNGSIWAYGMGLLAYYSHEENRFIHIKSDAFRENGIEYDFVNNLFEDREKNVWVCTNKGLYRFNTAAQVFRNIANHRSGDTVAVQNSVSGIIQTKSNAIWVSTAGAGIFSYNDQMLPIANPVTDATPANKSLHANSMLQRRNGELWIGTHSGGLYIYDPQANKNSSVSVATLKGETIASLLEDKQGNIWIGTTSGILIKCENGNWKDTSGAFKMISAEMGDVMKLYEDNNGHLWICTASYGLYEMDTRNEKTISHFTEGADKGTGLLNDGATDIIQWNDSTFLIASDGLCILNYKTKKFRYLTPQDGLPSEHITTLIIDKQKRLWVLLDAGLYRLNIDNKLFVSYDAADGITHNIFELAAAAILDDGRMAISTSRDFLVFDPEKTIDKTEVPSTNITGIVLGNRHIAVDSLLNLGKLVLPYNNTFISFELSTLSFRHKYNMYYMLEGLDNTWKQVKNNELIYQYLPAGDYTLKLKAENGEGVESKKITTLHIHVNAPFWKTWWFYSLLILLIGGLLLWLDRSRIKRREAIYAMRSDIADGLHKEINAALSNITILSEMAKMKADSEPEKSKEFIEQIHAKSNNMTVAMDDMLWSIDPNNDNMQYFISRFREYTDALKNRNDVQIDLLVDKKVEALQLNMKLRKDIFWLFKGGITNVIKSGGVNNKIHISYDKPVLIYTLEFDTSKMDMDQLNNLRLRKELSDKLDDLGAWLDFKEHSMTAVFVLKIPIRKDGY